MCCEGADHCTVRALPLPSTFTDVGDAVECHDMHRNLIVDDKTKGSALLQETDSL